MRGSVGMVERRRKTAWPGEEEELAMGVYCVGGEGNNEDSVWEVRDQMLPIYICSSEGSCKNGTNHI